MLGESFICVIIGDSMYGQDVEGKIVVLDVLSKDNVR